MGRTRMLADTIARIRASGAHRIGFIWTSRAEPHYDCPEDVFRDLAAEVDCPFLCAPRVPDDLELGCTEGVDAVISVNFVNTIPEAFLRRFRNGVLNAHAGDLPRYRGNACPNWAILNGEDAVVLTIHQMEADLDSGPVYLKRAFPLGEHSYITDVYDWLAGAVPLAFCETIDAIAQGARPAAQPSIRAMRTFPRRPEDARIDWSSGVGTVYRMIRASSRPFSGAFGYFEGRKVTIWRARPVDLGYEFCAADGQVLEVDRESHTFAVASRNQALAVQDFSLEGLNQAESFAAIAASLRNRLA